MFAVLISIVLQHVEHINFNILYGSALDLVLNEDLKFHVVLVHNPLEPPPHHIIIRSKFMDIFLSLGSRSGTRPSLQAIATSLGAAITSS